MHRRGIDAGVCEDYYSNVPLVRHLYKKGGVMLEENGVLFMKLFEALDTLTKVLKMIEELRLKELTPPNTLNSIIRSADTILEDIRPHYQATRRTIGEYN